MKTITVERAENLIGLLKKLTLRFIMQASAAIKNVVFSKTGAWVYSDTELARLELPEVDVGLCGALSIALQLQDPLARLINREC